MGKWPLRRSTGGTTKAAGARSLSSAVHLPSTFAPPVVAGHGSLRGSDTGLISDRTSSGVLSALLEATTDAVVVMRSVRHRGEVVDFECILANAAAEHTLGIGVDEVVGSRIGEAVPRADEWMPNFVRAVEAGEPFSTEFDWCRGNEHRVVSMRARPVADGEFDGVVVVLGDSTEVRDLTTSVDELLERQRELELQALHDPLTGCANRLLIETRLEHGISRLGRHQGMLAVLFVDLDGFKQVNDEHGHAVGDSVLITVANRLRSQARPYDTVARLGGDEFVVVCEDLQDHADLDRIGRRLLDACREPIDVDGGEVTVAASIGVAIADSVDTDPATLIAEADTAMYRAKTYDGGWVTFADDEAERRRAARHDIEIGVADAIERGDLTAEFEPIVRSDDGVVVAEQVLVHWTHPIHGHVDDDAVGRTANDLGLAAALTEHMVDVAARRIAAMAGSDATWPMIVTVEGDVLCEPGFAVRVVDLLRQREVDPEALFIAVDGGYVADHLETARTAANALHDSGVRILRDNVAAPGSPLVYIEGMHIDHVRFDASLVDLDDPEKYRLITAICDSMKPTHRRSVAPGIVNAEQASKVRAIGADYLQGPYITRTVAESAGAATSAT